MRSLEEVLLRVLADHYFLNPVRIPKKTGVWLLNPERKIASMGVRIRRWVTLHGFALNVAPEKEFDFITPCGLEGVLMTSLENEVGAPVARAELQTHIVRSFREVFDLT
jgi:lipoate-protein ligase B